MKEGIHFIHLLGGKQHDGFGDDDGQGSTSPRQGRKRPDQRVSHSVTKRYFNINDTYMPSLEMIPRLCLALGNDILMRWLEARLQGGESFSREEIEEEMVRAANAFEELRTLVNEDPPPSVRDMQHAVNRLILELGCIQEILSGHSLHRSRGALPLCPWWKFWKK